MYTDEKADYDFATEPKKSVSEEPSEVKEAEELEEVK